MRALILVWALFVPAVAFAHGAFAPDAIGWTWDSAITLPLLTALVLFAAGWLRLHGRSNNARDGLRLRAVWFGGGWLVLAGALVSPLHEGGERSFTLHMTEHELLMLVAAPALVLARPLAIMLWAWPAGARQALGRIAARPAVSYCWHRATGPVVATLLQAAALWLWHAPVLFDLALADPAWHAAQHLSFLVSALLFWSAVVPRGRTGANAATRAVAALCLFATSIVSGALGALMAFSSSPWYAGYARIAMAPLGLSPAEDQQVAGLIMWVPGGLVHALAALAVARGLLREHMSEAAHAG
jgi:cytochrome c oxidase assembly factor CtaG